MAADQTFLWYDLETTGTDWRWQRIVQFAAQRTSMDLEPIGEPLEIKLDLTDDLLPEPGAVCVTGLGPQQLAGGVTEAALLRQVLPELTRPGTCLAGYNSLRFDDEFLRAALFRNFRDPYAHEWQGGNSRWDLLDMVRTAGALRPNGLVWPLREDGSPIYKLDRLAPANGIEHGNAHDALADVRATIALARKLRDAQPRLWAWYRRSADKHAMRKLLMPPLAAPLVHVSGRYPARHHCATLIASLAGLPDRSNEIVVVDLRHDPEPLLALPPEQLRELVFTRRDQLAPDAPQVGLRTVRLNRCPSLSPMAVLDEPALARMDLDLARCQANFDRLRAAGEQLAGKLAEVFQRKDNGQRPDPDAAMYDGFVGREDKEQCRQVAAAEPAELAGLEVHFRDWRLAPLLVRYKGRNFPEHLDEVSAAAWRRHVQQRLAGDLAGGPDLADHLQALAQHPGNDHPLHAPLLAALRRRALVLAERYGVEGLPDAMPVDG